MEREEVAGKKVKRGTDEIEVCDSVTHNVQFNVNCQMMNEKLLSVPAAPNTATTLNNSTVNQNNTLLDLIGGKADKTNVIVNLLMLGGAVNASIGDEIDSETLLPVNTLKKTDFTKELKDQ